jgi:hypothetical protein
MAQEFNVVFYSSRFLLLDGAQTGTFTRQGRSLPPGHQRAQNSEVFHVLQQIILFRRFHAAWQIAKPAVVDDMAEGVAADFVLTDPGVDPRASRDPFWNRSNETRGFGRGQAAHRLEQSPRSSL